MASKSALTVAGVLVSVTLGSAQQPAPPASQTAAIPAQPQVAPANPFQLPLIPLPVAQRPIVIEVDDRRVFGQLQDRPSLPGVQPAPCTTHKMPMAVVGPSTNPDPKMIIPGAAPKPPCT